MKFKLHAVREHKPATLDAKEIPADERDIILEAPSCCEAIVLAHKSVPDYLVTKWDVVEEEDKTSVKSGNAAETDITKGAPDGAPKL